MAYENQNKCDGCSISIPIVEQDADYEANLCDTCYENINNAEVDYPEEAP